MHDLLRILLLLCVAVQCIAQASLRADKTQVLIGDHIHLSLTINTPAGTEWINSDVVPADTVTAIDVLDMGTAQHTSAGAYSQYSNTWTIAVFDTGLVRIPPVPVILRNALGTDTQYTNDIPLIISGVTDSLGMAPIKPIIREPARFSDYLPYILGVAGIILLAVLAWMFRHRRSRPREVIEIRDEKPAHVIALEQLDVLEREKLWQQGRIKEYHSRMNHIMRAYLERRYQIPALESTSGEIITHLRRSALPGDLLQEIREVMEVEDLIKFAKAEPPVDIHAQYLEFARSLIVRTQYTPQTTAADD